VDGLATFAPPEREMYDAMGMRMAREGYVQETKRRGGNANRPPDQICGKINKDTPTIPSMRYDDAKTAMEWLCRVLGLNKHPVVPGEDGSIVHAELTFGNGMIMLGSTREDELGKYMKPPGAVGGVCTQSPYIVVENADAVHQRALDAGAVVVKEPADQDHGGRAFSCLDPEGQLWNVGTYDPWAARG